MAGSVAVPSAETFTAIMLVTIFSHCSFVTCFGPATCLRTFFAASFVAGGVTAAMLAPGAELTLVGKRSLDPKEKKMKAERVIIKGRRFDLYPERLK